jgi:tetratricopeptide (TPR) repeat protein
MRKVREALDDRASSPAYIETLQGRGYRFIAPVSVPPSMASPPHPTPVTPAVPGRLLSGPPRVAAWGRRGLPWAAMLVLSLLAGGRTGAPVAADERLAAADTLAAYACRLKSEGRVSDALEVIRRASALAPDSARITAEVGFYLHAAGHYDEEFPMLRRALALDDRSVDAWLHLGLAQARRENFDDAVQSLERARRLQADHPAVARWLAWARQQQHKTRATA